ncbi:MAG: A/G-specific adenine glycosylase [Planctomycetota bacterium]|nr:MAG: A/G-specific adenine glycosylase [Planctomycetota bacterium]
MLQQTTVSAVRPYFERFLNAFPDVASLAAADEADVLRLWEGLGYYSRARNLHRAARRLVADHGGDFPQTAEEWQRLPGVGRYTAAAIACFALGVRVPILEANTRRLYARLTADAGDVFGPAGERRLLAFAERLLPRRGVADFNQALMDLGATVCTPRTPQCATCPLLADCRTARIGQQSRIPRPRRRADPVRQREVAVAVEHGGHVLLRRCRPGERWAGLYDFVRFPAADHVDGGSSADGIAATVCDRTGIAVTDPVPLGTIRHAVTRYRIALECYRARAAHRRAPRNGFAWFRRCRLSELPLSSTGRRLAEMLAAAPCDR